MSQAPKNTHDRDLLPARIEMQERLDPLIAERAHQVRVEIEDGTPLLVDADVTRLAQVYANLLNNAAKYTEPGGRIRLTVERLGGDAVVRVRDNGVGIAAHMLPKVFDLFTQVDRSLEKSQGGLGIGLTLVKRLVELHGGGVEARSEGHGTGSEFVVRVQAHDARPLGGRPGERQAPVQAGGDVVGVPLELVGERERAACVEQLVATGDERPGGDHPCEDRGRRRAESA